MRTALVAAHHLTETGILRAELLLAGRSILGWQTALARDLGCKRIIVVANRPSPAILAAGHAAEAAGMTFQCLHGFARLPAMITADEELLVLGDGVIGNREMLMAIFAPSSGPAMRLPPAKLRQAIVCLPSAAPLMHDFPSDFERIDAGRCWAGVLAMRGAQVQRLSDFPPDSNAISLLLRLALQAGTQCVMLEAAAGMPAQWVLAHDANALASHETALLAQASDAASWHAPGLALAGWLAAASGTRGLARGEYAGMLAAGAALLAAAILAGLGHVLAALILAAAGSIAADLAARIAALRARIFSTQPSVRFANLRDPGRDLLASLVLMLALAPPPGIAAVAALGPLAIGTARIAARLYGAHCALIWQDRSLHLAALALAAGLGALAPATAILALAALAHALFNLRGQSIPQ